jgi:hypothetical protein
LSSRKEQKERLREERLQRERAAKAASERRRRMMIGGGVLAAAAIVAVVVVLVAGGGGGGSSDSSTTASNSGATTSNLDQSGLQTTKAPWKPEYSFLAQRLSTLNFPEQSDIGYHVHAALFVYVEGKQTTVPADIGIDPQGRFLAALHTHDASGIVHMEATKPYPFTLGEFINIWGVDFSDSQLGAYKAGNGNVLQLWVNGKQVADPVNYKMKEKDVMVLAYGKPGSFPTKKSYNFGQL